MNARTGYAIVAFHFDGSGVPEVLATCASRKRAERLFEILQQAGTTRDLRMQPCYLDLESDDEPRAVPEHPNALHQQTGRAG